MKKQTYGGFFCDGYRFASPEAAGKYAFSKVYATPAEQAIVMEKLRSGTNARYGYGFAELTIYCLKGAEQ